MCVKIAWRFVCFCQNEKWFACAYPCVWVKEQDFYLCPVSAHSCNMSKISFVFLDCFNHFHIFRFIPNVFVQVIRVSAVLVRHFLKCISLAAISSWPIGKVKKSCGSSRLGCKSNKQYFKYCSVIPSLKSINCASEKHINEGFIMKKEQKKKHKVSREIVGKTDVTVSEFLHLSLSRSRCEIQNSTKKKLTTLPISSNWWKNIYTLRVNWNCLPVALFLH